MKNILFFASYVCVSECAFIANKNGFYFYFFFPESFSPFNFDVCVGFI